MNTQKGFTLIELLVVVGIIGILSTIIVVALPQSLSKARDAKRMNNADMLVKGLELFYTDAGGYPASASPLVLGTGSGAVLSRSGFTALASATAPLYFPAIPTESDASLIWTYQGWSGPDPLIGTPCVAVAPSTCPGYKITLTLESPTPQYPNASNPAKGIVIGQKGFASVP